jgi:mannose-1-phosphate guanylyltransferase/mannose-6-phosphate isomerase
VQPVILAGGSGTRLWPMSREHYPKQLIGLLGDHSLLQSTALRLDGLAASHPVNDDVLIVCGEDHRFTTAEQLRVTGKRASIMLEPLGRDTAPALTLAALRIVADGGDAVMTVMPADHAVADRTRFHAAVAAGVHCAAQGKIATMGIVPARAETGYGYIRVGAPLGDAATGGLDVRRLDRFVEKPHLELARYVESGEYWWNSGIFIVRASVWLDAIRRLEPEIHAACEQAVANGKQDGDFFRVDRDVRRVAVELDRLRGDGAAREPAAAVRERGRAARRRLVGRRLVGRDLADPAEGRRRQRRPRPRAVRERRLDVRACGAAWSPVSARRIWSSSRRPTRCSSRTNRACRT